MPSSGSTGSPNRGCGNSANAGSGCGCRAAATVETVVGNLNALTRFSEFLATTTTDITSLADIDRAMLERFLAWLATQPIAAVTRSAQIGGLQLFFEAIRRHRWHDQLATTGVFSPTTTRSGHPTRLGESPNTS